MLTLAVSGACGKMGKRLIALASEDPNLKVSAAIERGGHEALGKDAGETAGSRRLGIAIQESLSQKVDVLIDFSHPEATEARLVECQRLAVPVVIGTTGHSESQLRLIESAAKHIPVLLSPNMSLGVNLLFSLVGQIAKFLGSDYDVEIVEAHHRFKKDAPSGTALRLLKEIASQTGADPEKVACYGRKGMVGEKPPREIGIHAVRVGDIVGEHTVIFSGMGERIEVVHRAHTRDTFARGALRGAKFLASKSVGLYTMRDVVGL